MIYLFKYYTSVKGTVKIEANNDQEAFEKLKFCKMSDYKWVTDPCKNDRTTYEVITPSNTDYISIKD